MASFNPQVGDIGLEIIVDFQTTDCNGRVIPLDISTASDLEICLRKPDHVTVTHYPAGFSSCGTLDGTDGSASYTTLGVNDLDVAGVWQVSGKVTFPDGRVFRGNSKNMRVDQPVCS